MGTSDKRYVYYNGSIRAPRRTIDIRAMGKYNIDIVKLQTFQGLLCALDDTLSPASATFYLWEDGSPTVCEIDRRRLGLILRPRKVLW